MMMAEVAACGETKFRKLAQNAAMKCCAFFEMRFSQGQYTYVHYFAKMYDIPAFII